MKLGGIDTEHLPKVLRRYAKASVRHPLTMTQEWTRFYKRCLIGAKERSKEGVFFEVNCFSEFSEKPKGPRLPEIISNLIKMDVNICSIADNGNSNAFDSLCNEESRRNILDWRRNQYEFDLDPDGRSMVVSSPDGEIVLLRSIRYMTKEGEISVHGYRGWFPKEEMSLRNAVRQGIDLGGFVILNRPFHWKGVGDKGYWALNEAIDAGACALEKSSTEIGPMMYSGVMVEHVAKRFGIPIVASGSASQSYLFDRSGPIFDKREYQRTLEDRAGNHASAVKDLIVEGKFVNHFNYATVLDVI